MAFWFNRYKNYTKRGEVYLFTLRDYCEIMLIKQFNGTYLVRKGVPEKAGYVMQFPVDQLDRIATFVVGDSDLSSVNNGSLITGQKTFLTEKVELATAGDGTTKVFRIAENLTANAEDYSIKVGGEAKAVTVNEGNLVFTGGTINPLMGTVTFTTAPADKTPIELSAVKITMTLNYQLLGDVLFAGLSKMDDPDEITLASTVLDATGDNKVFQLHKNLKKGTVKITFKLTEEGDAIGPLTDNNGVFSTTVEQVTTVYAHVDYATGVLTMEDDPVELSYEAHYFRAKE